jgi:O-methyltransferase
MQYVSPLLQALRLQRYARQIRHKLRAWGLLAWVSQVPEGDFFQCALNAINILKESGQEIGDYLEFGVSRGTSYACVYHALRQTGVNDARLIDFDSFEGFPKEAVHQGWEPGASASTLSATTRYLRKKGVPPHAMNFVKGWYKDSLTPETKARLSLSKTSLVMIDCDLYTSSCDALSFCATLLGDKAVIFFDDWGWRADLGEIGQKEAFEEFLADFPEFSAEPLPSYLAQARVFLVTRAGTRLQGKTGAILSAALLCASIA